MGSEDADRLRRGGEEISSFRACCSQGRLQQPYHRLYQHRRCGKVLYVLCTFLRYSIPLVRHSHLTPIDFTASQAWKSQWKAR